jgi:hypothetical protein
MSPSKSSETAKILESISDLKATFTKKLEDEIGKIKITIDAMQNSVTTNTDNIKKLDEKITKHQNACESDRKYVRKLTRTVDQKRLENDIVLKGFPNSEFDEQEVMQNIAAICGTTSGFNNCYKFTRKVGTDKETNLPILIHIVTISFVTHMDKMKVFGRLKDQGHFLLSDLITQCENKDKQQKIWIENSLTIENLKIKKFLLLLKRESKILGFTMRSGLFLAQRKDEFGQEAIFNVCEISQLYQMFPKYSTENEKEKKRARQSDSSDPATPVSKMPKGLKDPYAKQSQNDA